jgi:hypothetical protein
VLPLTKQVGNHPVLVANLKIFWFESTNSALQAASTGKP